LPLAAAFSGTSVIDGLAGAIAFEHSFKNLQDFQGSFNHKKITESEESD
jgi:hypothetical protein